MKTVNFIIHWVYKRSPLFMDSGKHPNIPYSVIFSVSDQEPVKRVIVPFTPIRIRKQKRKKCPVNFML